MKMLRGKREVNTSLLVSLALHSAAIIAFQLALMQLISIVQWHHFAYMIISIAMLGFGASGTLLALARSSLLKRAHWLVPLLMSTSGLFMILAFHITRLEVFQFDVYLLFVERSQFPILLANYLVFFIPFFTGALSIGMLFIEHAKHIGTYYFSNLLGSGLGGLLVLLLLNLVFPQQLPALIGLLSVIAGLAAMGSKTFRLLHVAIATAALIAAGLFLVRPGQIPISQYKGLAQALNLPEAEIVHTQPGIHGMTEVVASPALRFAPALSLSYTGPLPVKKNIFVNGDFYGVIPNYQRGQDEHILDYTTQALPWAVSSPGRILLLNAGEGAPLAHVFSHKPQHVDAIIPNRDVVRLFRHQFAAATDSLFFYDHLDIHRREARSFLASARDKPYDLIVLPQQDAFGGTAGINALQENYGMTLEAFRLMWASLSDEGMISASTWMDYPARTSLKLLASLVETAREAGIGSPGDHIAAIRSWGTISFVLKKTPISPGEAERIRAFAGERFFDIVLMPGMKDHEREQYNMVEDKMFFDYVDRILSGDDAFFQDYGFMVRPATDNKPYFSQFLQLSNIGYLSEIFGSDQVAFLELGYLIVLVTLLQSLILALLFIIMPLLRLRKSHRGKGGTLLYFGALGIGYMFVEIILIQRFVLYFGLPVYALSAVISTMLIFSGAGSLLSGRLSALPRSPARVGLAITGLLLVYTFLLTPILQWTIASPLLVKIVLSLLLIGIPSFFKGMMFPLGIRYLSEYDKSQTPWAWGINGSVSVISTSLAMIIAVEAGFTAVMTLAVCFYALAATVFMGHRIFFPVPASPAG